MKVVSRLNVRIANYIMRRMDNYVSRRKKIETEKANIAWLRHFQNNEYFVYELEDKLKIKLYKDSVLSRLIYDGFETSEIEFLRNFLMEGDCFIDIGSNVGLFSLYASGKVGLTGAVIAFEPAGQTYDRLLENMHLNDLKNIQANKLGLSDKDEILELNISSNGFEAWNTFVQTSDNKFSMKESVRVTSLDHFLDENKIDKSRISLIKLDVEGFEINVLKGSSELLQRRDAPVFLIEFTDANAVSAGNCCHELYKLMIQYGYSWYTYDANQKKLNKEPMRVSYPYNNLIAIKNPEANGNISEFIF